MSEQSGRRITLVSACFIATAMIAIVGNYQFRALFGDIHDRLTAFSVEQSCKPLAAPYGVYWYTQDHDFKPITKKDYIDAVAAAKVRQQEYFPSFSIQNELYGC